MQKSDKRRSWTEQEEKEFTAMHELVKRTTGKEDLPLEELMKEVKNNPTLKEAFKKMFERLYPTLSKEGEKWKNVKLRDLPPEGVAHVIKIMKELDPIGFEENRKKWDLLSKLEKKAWGIDEGMEMIEDINEFIRKTKVDKAVSRELMDSLDPAEWKAFKMGALWAFEYIVKPKKYDDRHFKEVDRLIQKGYGKEAAYQEVAERYRFSWESFARQYRDRHANKKTSLKKK